MIITKVGLPSSHTRSNFLLLAMADPLALPALGGNATAALAVPGTGLEEVVIHSGAATAEGDISYMDEDFDPFSRKDPRREMPGVLTLGWSTISLTL